MAAAGPRTHPTHSPIWVKDYLDNPAASPGTDSIILDRLDPVVAFADDDILVNSEFQMLEGSTGSDYYEISEANGIAAYAWEYISGPGSPLYLI